MRILSFVILSLLIGLSASCEEKDSAKSTGSVSTETSAETEVNTSSEPEPIDESIYDSEPIEESDDNEAEGEPQWEEL